MSASNLIKRIREFSSAQDLGDVVNEGERTGPLLPDAIKQLMLT
jgi:hypothetical protein